LLHFAVLPRYTVHGVRHILQHKIEIHFIQLWKEEIVSKEEDDSETTDSYSLNLRSVDNDVTPHRISICKKAVTKLNNVGVTEQSHNLQFAVLMMQKINKLKRKTWII
tara:strand:- start:759 stop:1082 length:324 start_codon:yes stop_codon:yes gene_type:complete